MLNMVLGCYYDIVLINCLYYHIGNEQIDHLHKLQRLIYNYCHSCMKQYLCH